MSLLRAFRDANRTRLGTIEPYYVKMFRLAAGRNISVQIEIPSDIKVLCLLQRLCSPCETFPLGVLGGEYDKRRNLENSASE